MTRLTTGALALLLAATPPRVSTLATQSPVFRVERSGVVIDVSVRANGRPVRGLTQADFKLWDDGVEQRIDAVEPFSGAVEATLVLDEALGRINPSRQLS